MKKPTRAAKKSISKSKRPKKFKPSGMGAPKTNANLSTKKKMRRTGKVVTMRPKALQREVVKPLNAEAKGMSFAAVIRNIDPTPKFNSREVSVIRFTGDRIKRKGNYHVAIATATRTVDQDKEEIRFWKQMIYARDTNYQGKLYNCPKVVLHCQCQYFTFYCEYSLWKAGVAEIISGNGAAPAEKNIRLIPMPCKHLYLSYHKLREEQL